MGVDAQAAPGDGRSDRDLLGGDGAAVEIDQTFIGGPTQVRSNRYANKAEVAIAVDSVHPKGLGRVPTSPHRHRRSQERAVQLYPAVRRSRINRLHRRRSRHRDITNKSQSRDEPMMTMSSPNASPPHAPSCASSGLAAETLARGDTPRRSYQRVPSTTSTSSPSGSTVATAAHEDCFGIGSCNKPSSPTHIPSTSTNTTYSAHWS